LAFSYGDFLNKTGISSRENLQAALIGMLCHALLALVLWRSTLANLEPKKDRVTGTKTGVNENRCHNENRCQICFPQPRTRKTDLL
jgi:hypothetical protein